MKCDEFRAPYGLNMFVRYGIIKDIRHRPSAMATERVMNTEFFPPKSTESTYRFIYIYIYYILTYEM